ncbi:MAG: hypothetical protein Q7T61_15945 [Caulobacter sp.]|nr:hypothetical protein [Caulobacter sp.]
MKRIILAAVAVSALALASQASAATGASATVNVGGSVTGACGNGAQSGGGVSAPSTISLGNMVDANGQLNVAEKDIEFGNTWCNGPANLSVTVSALDSGQGTPADAGSFVSKLDMVVNGKIIDTYMGGGVAKTGAPKTAPINQAFETGTGQYSKAKLNVTLPAGTVGNDRPVAGTYSGTVVFTATPQ